MKVRGKFMNIIIAFRWKKRSKMFAPNLEENLRRNFRKDLTWRSLFMVEIYVQRAKDFLKPFLKR